MAKFISFFCLVLFYLFVATIPIYAMVDPLAVPNNKFGIHIIQATPDESSPAASLVNSSGGDWGYITVLIEDRDRKIDKWQEFFNDLRRRHLIPIVRIATHPEGPPAGGWKKPTEGEENEWADFLNNLNWPVKNRYVIIFNEPNHATEWGNFVDPKSYSKTLDKFITALKNKSQDFFVLNAGLDASAPQLLPNYMDQAVFMREMNEEVPGIFERLDGWVSHSYPNPAFSGSPNATGRETVNGWFWELQQLRILGVNKNLPVFITETGWKHAEGINYDPSLHSVEQVAQYYKEAFNNAWSSNRVVAVTPFLLSYQEPLFAHFSFKSLNNDYYPQFQAIQEIPKIKGKPIQEKKAQLIKGEIFSSLVAGENYNISLTFKNVGQSIWNDSDLVNLRFLEGGNSLGLETIEIPKDIKIEPGKEYTFSLNLKAPKSGNFKVNLNLFEGNTKFDSPPLEFQTEVKSPVVLQIKTKLKWKKDYSGEYLLSIQGPVGQSNMVINLLEDGESENIEARFLLPDYAADFTLQRQVNNSNGKIITHKPKTIRQTLKTGMNILDFDTLQPNLLGNIIHPQTLWSILPFSN